MPKFDVIQAESNAGIISAEERVYIREILGISQNTSVDDYNTSETRFTELSKRVADGISATLEAQNIFLCKSLRVLYKSYGNLGEDMTSLKGGSDGVDYSADRNRTRIALQIQNIVLPETTQVPLEPVPAEKFDNRNATTVFSVPIRYGELVDLGGDEYSP